MRRKIITRWKSSQQLQSKLILNFERYQIFLALRTGSNYKERLSKAEMLPISLEIQLRSLILLNRLLNGLYSNFPILSHISFTIPNSGAYNTRFSEKPMFHLPKVKKTRTAHDFFYRVPKLVNYFHANTNLDIFNNPASFK